MASTSNRIDALVSLVWELDDNAEAFREIALPLYGHRVIFAARRTFWKCRVRLIILNCGQEKNRQQRIRRSVGAVETCQRLELGGNGGQNAPLPWNVASHT